MSLIIRVVTIRHSRIAVKVLVSKDFPKRRGRLKNKQLEAECVIRYTYSVLSIQRKFPSRILGNVCIPIGYNLCKSSISILFFTKLQKNPFIKTAGRKKFPSYSFYFICFSPFSSLLLFFSPVSKIHSPPFIPDNSGFLFIEGIQTALHHFYVITQWAFGPFFKSLKVEWPMCTFLHISPFFKFARFCNFSVYAPKIK